MIQAEAVTGGFETKWGCEKGQGEVRQIIAVCYVTANFGTVISSEK